MCEEWENPNYSSSWEKYTLYPTRSEQVDVLLTIIEKIYQPNGCILDFGIGSGQIEEQLLQRISYVNIIGIDNSDTMLELSKQRLKQYSSQVKLIKGDLNDIENLDLSEANYQVVLCFQTIHHVVNEKKQAFFRFVYNHLAPGGVFLLGDKIKLNLDKSTDIFEAVWDRLETRSFIKSGWSGERVISRLKTKEDEYPSLIEEYITMLNRIGFECNCVHTHFDRALFVAKK